MKGREGNGWERMGRGGKGSDGMDAPRSVLRGHPHIEVYGMGGDGYRVGE